jgi:hydrogenase maturation protease
MSRPTRIVIFGVGNLARGDDGLAPRLLESLRATAAVDGSRLSLVEDAQLQIEHALDLRDADLALFMDASVAARAPFALTELTPGAAHASALFSHALAPADVLHTFAALGGERVLPACFQLAIRGEHFELGADLSAAGRAHLAAAEALCRELLATPDAEAWRRHLTG